jgi:hypothetical protein
MILDVQRVGLDIDLLRAGRSLLVSPAGDKTGD